MDQTTIRLYEDLRRAAEAHGDEEGSATQVGDLEELLLACFEVLTLAQVDALLASDRVRALRDVPEYAGVLPGR